MATLSPAQLHRLCRFNSPTISNALELCCDRPLTEGFNIEDVRDFMPEMGPAVGYAVTATFSAAPPTGDQPQQIGALMAAIEAVRGPAVVVIRDLDSPGRIIGAPVGEVMATVCRALGARAIICDGSVRDYDEMRAAGIKVLARRLSVSHAHARILEVGCPVEVFGTQVRAGDLIHLDQHGFITIPADAAESVEATAARMDAAEIEHLIAPARQSGYTAADLVRGVAAYRQAISDGEW